MFILAHSIRHGDATKLRSILEEGKIRKSLQIQAIYHMLPYRMELASASFVNEGYPSTKDPSGIIFIPQHDPHIWYPFDSDYLLINGELRPGIEQFQFGDLETLLKRFPNAVRAGRALERFKRSRDSTHVHPNDYTKIPSEVVYLEDIALTPVATFGFPDSGVGLPNYATAIDYFRQ